MLLEDLLGLVGVAREGLAEVVKGATQENS